MHFLTLSCLILVNISLASPVLQNSEDMINSIPSEPIVNSGVPPCFTGASIDNNLDEASDDSPNIFRRFQTACPVTPDRVTKPKITPSHKTQSGIGDSDHNCDDSEFDIPVTCGGVALLKDPPEGTSTVVYYALNCLTGKFLFDDQNNIRN